MGAMLIMMVVGGDDSGRGCRNCEESQSRSTAQLPKPRL